MSGDDWRDDPKRGPWVRDNLMRNVRDMRAQADRCRRAFNKPYMGELADYLADVYDEAANVFQRKLDECRETAKEETR